MRPSQAILALETLRKSSSAPLRRKGVELSFNDSQIVLDVYQQWLLLLIDLGYLHSEDLLRTARRLWTDMVQADVLDLNNTFAECLHLIRMQNIKGFKALCSRISCHLYSLIKDDLQLVSRGDVRSARRLIQAFAYTSRLSLKDIDLTQQMLEDYMQIEDNISESLPMPLVRILNKIVKKWMKSFDPNRIHPAHGPGGVAFFGRKATKEVKYKDLASDQLLEYAFGDPWWSTGPIRSVLERTSQTIFVAKSYKTFRTISMEPSTLMYHQQGVWREIDRLVCEDSYLRNRVGFHEQLRNQKLARFGSISRKFATIDLSAASDSVSYKLVKEVFRGTKLLRYIVASRSKTTHLPDGRVITLKKFAPMGSALCFPIETLIFAAICEHVTGELRTAGKYSVFGDDIIVPTQCVESTIRLLESLGFRVNREKSFYRNDCWFRESCGGEYCDGFDVTPMRVSRKYESCEQDVRIAALIELANSAYVKNFKYLRIFFIRKLLEAGHKPWFSPNALLSDNYTNYHTKKRWNPYLQRIEVKVSDHSLRYSRKELDSQDESVRYRHWLEATHERINVYDGFQAVVCKPTKLVKESWRPKPYEDLDQVVIDRMLCEAKYPASKILRVEGLYQPIK